MLPRLTSYLVFVLCACVANAYGQLWEAMNGPGGGGYRSIITAANGDLYVISDNVIHRSIDQGLTWNLVVPHKQFSIPPHTPIVTFGTDIYLKSSSELWCSTDDGSTWQKRRDVSFFSGMAMTPSGTLVLSVKDSVCFSTDKGVSWRNTKPDSFYVAANIQVDIEGTIYASGASLFYRSTDNGMKWSTTYMEGTPGLPEEVISMPGKLLYMEYNRLHWSSDQGESWKIHFAPEVIRSVVALSADTLFVITMYGVILRSIDTGKIWTVFDSKLYSTGTSVAQLRVANGNLIVRFPSALFSRPLEGGDWRKLQVPNGIVHQLTFLPSGKLYAGSDAGSISTRQSLWIRDGSTWKEDPGLPPTTYVPKLGVDSSGKMLFIHNGTVMSYDGESDWEILDINDVETLVSSHDTILAFSQMNKGRRSTDYGQTWSNLELPKYTYLASAIAEPGVIYLAGDKLSRSMDAGITWEVMDPPFIIGSGPVRALYAKKNIVVMGVDNTGIYFSSDYGLTWENHSLGLDGGGGGSGTIVDLIASANGTLYAATSFGVYEFSRTSMRWVDIGDETLIKPILTLAFGQDGHLYVGSNGNGVYRSTKPFGPASSVANEPVTPSIAVFPNPASTAVQLKIGPHTGRYMVKIYNLLGEVMLATDQQEPLDVSTLPNGRYIVRVLIENTAYMTPLTISR